MNISTREHHREQRMTTTHLLQDAQRALNLNLDLLRHELFDLNLQATQHENFQQFVSVPQHRVVANLVSDVESVVERLALDEIIRAEVV